MNEERNSNKYSSFDITDASSRKKHLYQSLADSKDPMWREIGQKLHQGDISLRQVFADERYGDFIRTGLKRNSSVFFGSLTEVMDDPDDQESRSE